jgi:hypothetical protein
LELARLRWPRLVVLLFVCHDVIAGCRSLSDFVPNNSQIKNAAVQQGDFCRYQIAMRTAKKGYGYLASSGRQVLFFLDVCLYLGSKVLGDVRRLHAVVFLRMVGAVVQDLFLRIATGNPAAVKADVGALEF